jgi:hypothetical protein
MSTSIFLARSIGPVMAHVGSNLLVVGAVLCCFEFFSGVMS